MVDFLEENTAELWDNTIEKNITMDLQLELQKYNQKIQNIL